MKYLNNPFKSVIGPKYAPHEPTLSSTFEKKVWDSMDVIRDMIMFIPDIIFTGTLDIAVEIAEPILYSRKPIIKYGLLVPVVIPTALIACAVTAAYYLAILPVFFTSVVLALACMPITAIVHGISSWIYSGMQAVANSLTSMKDKETFGAFINVKEPEVKADYAIIGSKGKSDTYYIHSSFYQHERHNEFNSSEFSLTDVISGKNQTPTTLAVSNLFKINRELALAVEQHEQIRKYS